MIHSKHTSTKSSSFYFWSGLAHNSQSLYPHCKPQRSHCGIQLRGTAFILYIFNIKISQVGFPCCTLNNCNHVDTMSLKCSIKAKLSIIFLNIFPLHLLNHGIISFSSIHLFEISSFPCCHIHIFLPSSKITVTQPCHSHFAHTWKSHLPLIYPINMGFTQGPSKM